MNGLNIYFMFYILYQIAVEHGNPWVTKECKVCKRVHNNEIKINNLDYG